MARLKGASTDLTYLNDLRLDEYGNSSLVKYADDGSIATPVVKDMVDESPRAIGVFLDWTQRNGMKIKCKKFVG